MRLVGASNFYIQLPFLLEGVIAGLFGWMIAAALLVGVNRCCWTPPAVLPLQRPALAWAT